MRPPAVTRDTTVAEALHRVAARFPRRIAIVNGDERVTYRALNERVLSLAAALREMGIGTGDRVATLLWQDADFVYLLFACAEIGAVIAPLPARLRTAQMESFLRELAPSLIVASSELEVTGGRELLTALPQQMPRLRRVIITDGPSPDAGSFRAMLEHSHSPATSAPPRPQDLLVIVYTSGTTGQAKGVMHSHRGLVAPVVASLKLREMWLLSFPTFSHVRRWTRVLVRYGLRLARAAGRQQVFLSTMGTHTIAGLEALLETLLMGDRLVLLPRFHPTRALELIEREHVSVFIAMPMAYTTMLRAQDFDRYDLSSLLIAATGSAPCSPELAREIQRRFRCAVHIGFGMTELGGGIAATSLEDAPADQAETVGKAMPGMGVRIVDDRHQPLPLGEVGELAVQSDGQMLGYFGGRGDLGEVLDDQGWFYTGDLATMDADGYIRIVGRKKDVIIRAGQKIYPAHIEAHLEQMNGVREAAVVGVPDDLAGESVWAYVIPQNGSRLTEMRVLAHCRASLETYEIPEQVRIVRDLPRTSFGKPQKYRLREMALEELRAHARGR